MHFFSWKNIFFYFLLLLVFLFAYSYTFDAKLSFAGDNANYYSLAKGLAEVNTYAANFLPSPRPANHFPPGYPFIMSVAMRLGIDSIFAMKVLNGLLLFISSILLHQITLRLTKNFVLSFVVAALMLLNANLLEYASIMMSEIPFLAFLLLTIYMFIRTKEASFSLRNPYFYLFILSMVALLYVRTIGISIFGAALLILLFNKKFKASAVLFFSVFILMLPWQIRSANLGGNSYMRQVMSVNPYDASKGKMAFGNWVDRAKNNSLRYISKEIPSSFFPSLKTLYKDPTTAKLIPAPMINWILGPILMILIIFGVWSVKDYRWFFLLFFGATLTILFLWPDVWFGIRFVLPTIPLAFLFAVLGLYFLVQLILKSRFNLLGSKNFSFVLLALLFVQVNPIKELHEKAEKEHPKLWRNFIRIAEWAGDNLDEDAVVATRKPAIFYVVSHVKTNVFPYTADRGEFLEKFEESGATHALIEQLGFFQTSKYLAPAVKSEPEKFPVAHSLNATPVQDKNGQKISLREAIWLVEYKPELGYNGPYKDGLRNGDGEYKTKAGVLIQAHWVNDTLHGPGKMTMNDGRIFEGEWVKGKKHGVFYIQTKDQRFESEWVHGVMNQYGYTLDEEGNRIQKVRMR